MNATSDIYMGLSDASSWDRVSSFSLASLANLSLSLSGSLIYPYHRSLSAPGKDNRTNDRSFAIEEVVLQKVSSLSLKHLKHPLTLLETPRSCIDTTALSLYYSRFPVNG